MARSEARLQFGIWRGLEPVTPGGRLMYVVLLTERTVNHSGIGAIRLDQWERSSGLSHSNMEKALDSLTRARHVLLDYTTGEFLIRTMIRNDNYESQPYLLKGALKDALLTESPLLRRELAGELRKLGPQRPPKAGKDGRVVTYPDPHAVADLLDPPGPDGTRTPVEEPLGRHSREALETLSEPGEQDWTEGLETLSDSDKTKGFPDPPERALGGGGGGGVGNPPPVGNNSSLKSRARKNEQLPLVAPVPTPTEVDRGVRKQRRAERSPAALNASAHSPIAHTLVEAFRTSCKVPPTGRVLRQWHVEVERLLQDRVPPEAVAAGLAACSQAGYPPAALANFTYGEANRAAPTASLTRSERRFIELQSLKTPEGDALPPPRLRAIEGA